MIRPEDYEREMLHDPQFDEDFDDHFPDDEPDQFMSDAEADADALASAGWGTDEDYGYFGENEYDGGYFD